MAPSTSFQNKITGALNFLNKNNGSSLDEIEKYFGVKFGSLMTKSQLRLAVVRALKNDVKNGAIVEKNKRFFLADPGIECPCMNIRSTDDMDSGCPMRRRRSACKRRKRRCKQRRRRRRRSGCRRRRRSRCKRRRRRSACKRRRRRRSGCRRRSKSLYPEDEPSNRTYSKHGRPAGNSRETEQNKPFHAYYDIKTTEDSANQSDQ